MPWPTDWDRGTVHGAIEEASGTPLRADDSLPDMLIAKAQELRLKPVDLKLWIYDQPAHPWTPDELEKWARRNHLVEPLAICGHCGQGMYSPDDAVRHVNECKGGGQS